MSLFCPRCARENLEGMRFCVACAAPLTRICTSCTGENPRDAAFCGRCGARLGVATTGPTAQAESSSPARPGAVVTAPRTKPPSIDAELRHLSVMFCDLVGSTPLSEQIDPEELCDVVRAYQESCGAIIRVFEGHVAQYSGDGILAYFGYPRAHEDDAIRAASAALAILDELPSLNARVSANSPRLHASPLDVRIGIHTGMAVVGAIGSDEQALGHTLHVASRLQTVADPGTAVISAATRHLIGDAFVLEDLGMRSLKGIVDPVPVFRVLRTSPTRDRRGREAAARSPLVGRDQEISLMLDRWEQVTDGHGQTVIVSGEAGMGKSRLVQALRERLAGTAHAWIEGGCSPYHENSAFHPIVECLAHRLALRRDNAPEVNIGKIEAALRPTGITLDEAVPLVASLLSVPVPDRYPSLQHLSAEAQRRKTLEALAAWLFAISEEHPVVMLIEDLHWIDPSSLELVQTLVGQVPTARVFMVLTHRPGVDVSWATQSHVVHLALHPLTRKQVTTIVDRVTGGKPLPAVVLDHVVAKTDGVPLFVEELTKAIIESDLLVEHDRQFERADPLPRFAIPATLQDSLMARLDRLGPAKGVAQLAAVIGREFPYELLAAVTSRDTATLTAALDQLGSAELVYRRGTPPRAVYTFKHALVQDTAYRSLLKKKCQEYHARIARTLEQRFPERVALEPEVAARHYEEAGLVAEAIPLYERAGARAAQRSAHREAISHLRKGLALLTTLPWSPDRDRQELRLQVKLGAPLLESRGYGDIEVEQAYTRARELCGVVGDAPESFRAIWGLAVFYHARNELVTAVEMGRDLMDVAERAGDRALLLSASISVGCPQLWQGKFATCLEWMERAIALYDPERHRELAYVYGENPGVSSRVYAAQALWYLGFPDRALRMTDEAVAVAEDGIHPFSRAYALSFKAAIHLMRCERDRAREAADAAIAFAEAQHLTFWLEIGRFYRGWATAEPQAGSTALDMIETAVARMAASGTEVAAPSALGIFADAYATCGRLDAALQTIDNGLTLAEMRQSPFWSAELLRLKGELLLRRDGAKAAADAESLFRRALATAREQEARSFELRTAVSLARLLRRQNRTADARALLAPAYAWFTEGYDTVDLTEARALLDELS